MAGARTNLSLCTCPVSRVACALRGAPGVGFRLVTVEVQKRYKKLQISLDSRVLRYFSLIRGCAGSLSHMHITHSLSSRRRVCLCLCHRHTVCVSHRT